MKDEYISREDAVNIAESYEVKIDGFCLDDYEYGRDQVANSIANDLEDIAAADVVPVETIQAKISELKYQMDCKTPNVDYYTGYMSALYTVEDIIAKMDGGKS